MKKILFLLMMFIPVFCFAASGILTSQGGVSSLPISKGQKWEISCDNSKEEIQMVNWNTGDCITFKKTGNMSVNGALNYDSYFKGKNISSVWIYLRINNNNINEMSIKTFYGTTYFKP